MISDQPPWPRRDALRGRELFCLLPICGPLLVLAGAGALFELAAFDLPALSADIFHGSADGGPASAAIALQQSRAQALWGLAVLLYVAVGVGATILVAMIQRRFVGGPCRRALLAVGAVICLITLAQLYLADSQGWALSGIFHFTFETLSRLAVLPAGELRAVGAVVTFLNIFGAIVPVFLLLTGCAVMVPPFPDDDPEAQAIAQRMYKVRELLGIGSAIMVVGILHMGAWMSWPAALVADATLKAEIEGLSRAMTLYWGGTFSLVIASYYIPVAVWLSGRAERSLKGRAMTDAERQKWLRERGLSVLPARQLPQFATMLAPLAAGPLGSALAGLGSHFAV